MCGGGGGGGEGTPCYAHVPVTCSDVCAHCTYVGDEWQSGDAHLGGSHHGPSDAANLGQWCMHTHRHRQCYPMHTTPSTCLPPPYMQYKTKEDQRRTYLMARVRVSGVDPQCGSHVCIGVIPGI